MDDETQPPPKRTRLNGIEPTVEVIDEPQLVSEFITIDNRKAFVALMEPLRNQGEYTLSWDAEYITIAKPWPRNMKEVIGNLTCSVPLSRLVQGGIPIQANLLSSSSSSSSAPSSSSASSSSSSSSSSIGAHDRRNAPEFSDAKIEDGPPVVQEPTHHQHQTFDWYSRCTSLRAELARVQVERGLNEATFPTTRIRIRAPWPFMPESIQVDAVKVGGSDFIAVQCLAADTVVRQSVEQTFKF